MRINQTFFGETNLREKLCFSLITAKAIRIVQIRSKSTDPGINKAEECFLNLLIKISNGTTIRINDTGTNINFIPGTLIGLKNNETIKCEKSRGIAYYLEPLLLLSFFCKDNVDVNLSGVTDCESDLSVDLIRKTWLPIVKKFVGAAAASEISIRVVKRGLQPFGGGIVHVISKPVNVIIPNQLVFPGKIHKIRGIAWTCNSNRTHANQMIAAAKEILLKCLTNVYINIENVTQDGVGKSLGFGITLWAESKEGAFYSAQAISEPQTPGQYSKPTIPHDLGIQAAGNLLQEIYNGGFVDRGFQSFILTLMSLEGGRNINQLCIGNPTPYSIETLRLINTFLGVKFHLKYIEEDETLDNVPSRIIATCISSGLQNTSRTLR
ncbi:rRNA-processing endoribonuclease [Cichlidogyrus casuarinus]|uniref:rRNA-processing endoribonuclease n=1 Tax=Cichlidogyrus casuarinus TaxID=1844966 RepID=A0ABD2QE37_9PLAT